MYLYLAIPIVAFLVSQITKIILKYPHQKIKFRDLFSYSDMPSSHTAVVISLAMTIFLRTGLDSPLFAISFVLAAIVITDAVGLRNYLGQHGRTLNILVKDLKEDEFLDRKYPKQLEHIGHTPLQILIGAAIGVLISLIGYWIF